MPTDREGGHGLSFRVLLKVLFKFGFQTRYAGGNRARQEACHLRHFCRAQILQVQRHDLPICRLEFADPGMKPCQRIIAFDQAAQVGQTRHLFEFVKVDTHDRAPSFTIDMTCRNIVDDAVDPGFERTTPIKGGEALPKLDMHVLQQIAAPFGMCLCCPRQALHGVSKLVSGLDIKLICGLTWLHTLLV